MKKNVPPQLIAGLVVVLVVLVTALLLVSRRIQEQDAPVAGACVNQCGNGSCEELVCMAEGCPCAETAESCPQDCAAER